MALKLKLSVGGSGGSGSSQTPKTSGSPEPTPKSRSATPKIKIKPPKPEPEPEDVKTPKKIKLSLGTKNSKKLVGVKTARAVPRVRIKPTRVPGEGYDSEAPDVEDDPLIEQGMVIRFLDDTNLDFVHSACELGDYTGLNIKWISKDKAVVNVNGTLYLARVIDLPTITEIFKTTDRKNIFKTLDVSQMLLVIKKVDPEKLRKDKDFEVPQEKLYHHPLYKMALNKEFKENRYVWRDGLLPPFEDVFRRFRPRKLNHRVMDLVDARVNELIKRDEDAEELAFEIVDPRKMPLGAPGTPGVAGTPTGVSLSNTPRNWGNGGQLGTPLAAGTPAPAFADDLDEFEGVNLEEELNKVLDGSVGDDLFSGIAIEREEGDEDEAEDEAEEPDEPEEDDDSDDDDDDDDDDDQHLKMLNEEIADLEKAVESNKRHLDLASLRMMRMKFQTSYNSLRQLLDQKKRALAKLLEEQRKLDPTSQQGALALAAAAAATAGVATAGVGDGDDDGDDGDDDDEADNNDDGDGDNGENGEEGDGGDDGDDGETPAANGDDDDDIELDDNDIDDLF